MDPKSNKRRPKEDVRNLLCKRNCRGVADSNSSASKIREALKRKFWLEKEGHGVNWTITYYELTLPYTYTELMYETIISVCNACDFI